MIIFVMVSQMQPLNGAFFVKYLIFKIISDINMHSTALMKYHKNIGKTRIFRFDFKYECHSNKHSLRLQLIEQTTIIFRS